MNFSELKQIIEPILRHSISEEQAEIIQHSNGPLWVIAGPGSGKSEVLVIRTLKLIFVDNINPKSIIITTFTEKAARNLFERILNYASYIFQNYPALSRVIDINSLRVGTMHGLCNDIMLEYKYPEYENYRLLDDIEKYLFIYENSLFVNDKSDKFLPLCEMFQFFFNHYDRITGSGGWNDHSKLPNKWRRTKAALTLYDRIVEDQIRLDLLEDAGNSWELLAEIYNDYKSSLENHRRCDFAHLQQKFLDFLKKPLGRRFLQGNNTDLHPGIRYVMVDEYQDTNPIQESLYFELAKDNHNLCIVGDDDQALYRFRGGTVDCMVTFDQACSREWGITFRQEWKKFLSTNYRSHPDIVKYYDRYISSFEAMRLIGARVQGKPRLTSGSGITGDYLAVAFLTDSTIEKTANRFAELVAGLIENKIVQNPSQCALLMRSVKETERYAGPFALALRDVGIMPYNPRSR